MTVIFLSIFNRSVTAELEHSSEPPVSQADWRERPVRLAEVGQVKTAGEAFHPFSHGFG